MVTITDDMGDSVSTERVYYDLQIGEFVRFQKDGNSLMEIDVFSGDVYQDWAEETFTEEGLASEFREMDENILADPIRVLEEVMNGILSGSRDPLVGYETWEVRFCWNAVSLSQRDLE